MTKKKVTNEQKYEKISVLSEQEISRDILPQNVIKMGEQVLHDKNIYILQSVYKEIHDFTKDKLTVETGGMLMGYTMQANGKINIIIDGFIEGKYSESTPTTLKFTHETWDHVYKEADEHYPDDKIIGWIHTHPNFGIFLSDYDKFIQQNFFNDENQLAYVVDPIQHIEGFFFWCNGQIEKCPGFFIYDKIGSEIDLSELFTMQTTAKQANKPASVIKENQKGLYIAYGILSLLSIIGFIALSARISELHESINTLNEQLLTQNQTIAANVQTIDQDLASLKTDIGKNTIVFLSDDGTLLEKQEYATGEVIVPPTDIPKKSDDEMYTYTFSGWDSDFGYAVCDAVYQAVYTSKLREYMIIFEDENGNEISSETYHFGDEITVPEYFPNEIPDDEKNYEVTWDKEIATVSGDTTYRAVIKEISSDNSSDTEDSMTEDSMTDQEILKGTTEDTTSNETSISE